MSRPNKFQPGDKVIGHADGKPSWIRNERGTVVERRTDTGEYTLRLDSGEITYVKSTWIRRASELWSTEETLGGSR